MAERELTDTVQVRIRMPEHLRRRIDVQATQRGRTLNDECVRLLVKALDEDPQKMIAVLKEALTSEVRETIKNELHPASAKLGGEGGLNANADVQGPGGEKKT
jgi:hypothetical protein